MPVVTYEEAKAAIGTLPSMHPEPNFDNRRATYRDLAAKLMTIPSTQATRNGHRGMVEDPVTYAARGEPAWVYPPNPGLRPAFPNHRNVSDIEKERIKDTWRVADETYQTINNVHRAAFEAIRVAVPEVYHNNPATGTTDWHINMTLHEIFASLDPYCRPTTMQIENNDATLMKPYNHTQPIAALFKRFEECRDIAFASKNPYTSRRFEQKFIAHMERTGVYHEAIEKWRAKPEADRTWENLKTYWLEKSLERRNRPTSTMSGAGYQSQNPYANLAGEIDEDSASLDDSVATITENFSALMTQANEQRDTIARLERELTALKNVTTPAQPPFQAQPPMYAPPPQPYPYYPPPHNAYLAQGGTAPYTGPAQQRSGARNRQRGRKGRSAPGRGGYGQFQQQQYGTPQMATQYRQPYGYGAQQQTGAPPAYQQQIRAPFSNKTKKEEGDKFCWSCGYDADHDGFHCPRPWANHQPGATRYNLRNYLQCGKWSQKGRHKNVTPSGVAIVWDDIDPPNM